VRHGFCGADRALSGAHDRQLGRRPRTRRGVGAAGRRAGLRRPGQSGRPSRDRRAAGQPGPSPLGVRRPAEVRGLPNLIEPWWKILRSLALNGRRFEAREDVCQAVASATAYRNAHRHPFVRGRARRRRAARQPGVAALPRIA